MRAICSADVPLLSPTQCRVPVVLGKPLFKAIDRRPQNELSLGHDGLEGRLKPVQIERFCPFRSRKGTCIIVWFALRGRIKDVEALPPADFVYVIMSDDDP